MQKTYRVEGMSCASCAAAVERILQKIEGVEKAEVNLLLNQVSITNDVQNFDVYAKALEKGGFTLLPLEEVHTIHVQVNGMSCAACSAAVERILSRKEEIKNVQVNLVLNQAVIEYEGEARIKEWNEALTKGGFSLESLSEEKTITLKIEGMHCASCVQALEKVLQRQTGMIHVEVNLVTETAHITYDKKSIKVSEILAVIKQAGFKGIVQQENKVAPKKKSNLKIYVTLVIALVLLYIGMSHMMGNIKLPLPDMIHYETHPFHFALIQFVLATLILMIGHQFFTHGIKSLVHKTPNMDTLVAIGTGSAYLYSLYSLFQIASGNMHYVHSLYFESAGVVVALVMFGKHLESISKEKTTGAIAALLQLRPKQTILYRDGKEIVIDIEEVALEDLLVVKAGDHIPVDGIVVEGNSHVDESMLSGESMPVDKQKDDEVIGGTINLDGRLLIKCTAKEEDSTLSKMIHMVEEAQGKKAPIARIADRVSLYFVPVVMSIACIAALLWYVALHDLSFSLTIFVSVLVIACPCALGLATPTAIMVGTGKAASKGIFIKSGEALETASTINTIVFDKTGTITQGKPAVTDMMMETSDALSLLCALETGSKHPLAKAIIEKGKELHIENKEVESVKTLNGLGVQGSIAGKIMYAGNKALLTMHKVDAANYETTEAKWMEEGKTVVWLFDETQIYGLFAIADEIKDNAKYVVEQLKKQNIDVWMITGDNEITAKSIAKQAGIEHVIAQVLPDEKGNEIDRLHREGKTVAMVGDGINDALALSKSDVGIAIGSGSDVALESADLVLMKDDLEDVLTAIRLSKAVLRNIRQNLFWAFFYNSLGIPIAAGVLHIWGGPLLSPVFAGAAMAFSSVSVVSNALRLRNFK